MATATLTFALSGILGVAAMPVPIARGDEAAYLVNVTVRPGYNFANAAAALRYGHSVCGKVRNNLAYAQVMGDLRDDFNTADEYQASYLITQAVNELCPELIWQLRQSAADYRPSPR